MFKRSVSVWLASALLTCLGAAHASNDAEPAQRAQMLTAAWPSSEGLQAHQYLQDYPSGPAAQQAQALRERAQKVAEVLSRNDVALYTRAVNETASNQSLAADVHAAMQGDTKAAIRLAQAAREDKPQRFVGWLQLAAALGDERAAYDLALFFRTQGQPALAAKYETQAVALGFVRPTVLDHSRK
jgi:hypothetical protein